MPQLAAVTLNGYTTDAHVFTPVDIVKGQSTLTENLPLGANKLTQSILPRGDQGMRAMRNIEVPIVRTDVNGIPRIVGYNYGKLAMSFHPLSTEAERQLTVGLTGNSGKEAAFQVAAVAGQNYF